MKIIKDGNAVYVAEDDFVNLQESPSVWFSEDGNIGKILLKDGIEGLSAIDLRIIKQLLESESE